MSCAVGGRRSSDPSLPWLWCRLVATTLIGPLAWEPPYAEGVALKEQRQNRKQNPEELFPEPRSFHCAGQLPRVISSDPHKPHGYCCYPGATSEEAGLDERGHTAREW